MYFNKNNLKINPINIKKISSFSQKDYVTKSQNPFYFYLRLKKPLRVVEPNINYVDNSLILSKLQKKKIKVLKKRAKKILDEKIKENMNSIQNINKYKNMLPISVWNKCLEIYTNCKKDNTIYRNNYNENKKILVNNLSLPNIRNKFENHGLNKFIEYIDNK